MKKDGVLHHTLSEVIATMGHMDMLVIGDAGLPIPRETQRIDLALTAGIPGFIATVQAVTCELKVQAIIVAEETEKVSPEIYRQLLGLFPDAELRKVSHEELKALCARSVAVVRTGEFTPYANVILVSGVVF